MKGALTADCSLWPRLPVLVGLCLCVTVMFFLTDKAYGQAAGMGSTGATKMTNPVPLPIVPDRALPPGDGWAIAQPVLGPSASGAKVEVATEQPKAAAPCPTPSSQWSVSLSTLYNYSNQRSKIGGTSFQINSVTLDLAVRDDFSPYTAFDISYTYSHASGTAPNGSSDINQHNGFLRALQPLNEIWYREWRPADLSCSPTNQQVAIILAAGYGGSFSSISGSNVPLGRASGQNFLGDALFDYQFAWFTGRASSRQPDSSSLTHGYPNLLVEFTSGIASDTVRVDSSSSAATTSLTQKQLAYRTIASVTYSLPCRLGFLAAIEWDAALVSDAFHNSRPDHASNAIFTAGLVYNIYPDRYTGKLGLNGREEEEGLGPLHLHHWTFGLLYSHIAFDPLTETNTVQCQVSYSF